MAADAAAKRPVRLEQEEHGGGWLDHWPLAVCALLTLALVLWEEGVDRTIAPWPRFLLYLAAYALTAGGVVREAWRRAVRFDLFNEFSLMTVATVGAFILGEYAEGVTVMLFYCIGELFQEAALNRARRSIAALVDVRPRLATVVEGGRAAVVPAERCDRQPHPGQSRGAGSAGRQAAGGTGGIQCGRPDGRKPSGGGFGRRHGAGRNGQRRQCGGA